jgi:membrane protein required for colicin V production
VNWIDAVLVLMVGLSVISGFATGFARAGIEFIAAMLGIFLGFWCYGIVAAYFLDYVSSPQVADLIGFFIIFFGLLVVGAIVGTLIAKFFRSVGLSWFDRLLGGAFGVVRGVIVAAAVATVLLAFSPTPPPITVVDSRFLPYVTDVASVLAAMTPHQIKDAFHDTKDKAEKIWAEQASHRPPGLRRE